MEAHFPCAPRAARTASRTSFLDARATFCLSATYVRPDSERGNAPPTNSLYVFRTGSRPTATPVLCGRGRSSRGGRGSGRRCSRPPPHCERTREMRAEARPDRGESVSVELQVRLEPVQTALPAEAGLLVPAERRRRVEAVVRVGPDHARPQPLGHPEDPRPLLRPDARR